jgi:hypothetical protein
MAAFDRALALNAKHVDARISRAAAADRAEPRKGSRAGTGPAQGLGRDRAAGVLPAWLVGRSQRATLATAKAEFAEAVGLIDAMPPAVRLGSEPLLMAGALSHRALGNLEKAREYLEAVLGRNGRHYAAQLLLASILVEAWRVSRVPCPCWNPAARHAQGTAGAEMLGYGAPGAAPVRAGGRTV